MDYNNSFLSPSQVYNRISELEDKKEYNSLTLEEQEELEELNETYTEASMDYDMDAFF